MSDTLLWLISWCALSRTGRTVTHGDVQLIFWAHLLLQPPVPVHRSQTHKPCHCLGRRSTSCDKNAFVFCLPLRTARFLYRWFQRLSAVSLLKKNSSAPATVSLSISSATQRRSLARSYWERNQNQRSHAITLCNTSLRKPQLVCTGRIPRN
jgi:hypothetical protein